MTTIFTRRRFAGGMGRVALLVALVWCGLTGVAEAKDRSETYVPFRPDLPAGTAITIDARTVHPTQFALGWREVAAKVEGFDRKSGEELAAYLKKKDVPIVVGPGGVPYISDGHHTLRALIESKCPDKTAYGHIIANWAELAPDAFWQRMVESNYAFLRDAHDDAQPASALPASLTAMQRDPYRGLTWALREANAFDERKDVYFQEFFWGRYLRDKVRWDDTDDADFARAVREAATLAHAAGAQDLPGARPAP